MKKLALGLIAISTFAVASASMAASNTNLNSSKTAENITSSTSEFYVNGNAGIGKTDVKMPGLSMRDTGFAWSAAAGYQFNQYLAIEASYMRFPAVKVSGLPSALMKNVHNFNLAVKGIFPIDDKFSVFAKAGAAYASYKAGPLPFVVNNQVVTANSRVNKIVPLVGAGANFNIQQNLALTVQGNMTFKNGRMPSMFMGTLGLTYKF